MNSSIRQFFQKLDLGLLLIRLGLGSLVIMQGIHHFMGGKSTMVSMGKIVTCLGCGACPVFWGFLIAFIEMVGGLFFVLGLFFRLSCFSLFLVMGVTALFLWGKNADFIAVVSPPLKMAVVFLGMLFVGAGKYSMKKD